MMAVDVLLMRIAPLFQYVDHRQDAGAYRGKAVLHAGGYLGKHFLVDDTHLLQLFQVKVDDPGATTFISRWMALGRDTPAGCSR